MTDTPCKGAVISGIGISQIGRRTGISHLDNTLHSAREAIADAGLTPSDIDGVTTMGDTPVSAASAALGIEPAYRGGGISTGGLLSPVMSAAKAVVEGRARHVLVYRTVQMMGGEFVADKAEGGGDEPDEGVGNLIDVMADIEEVLAANAFSAVNWLAMHCRRHMEIYGTTKEQLGWLAINSRRNAALNPRAVYRDPMTMQDYLAARPVSSPLGLFDCDVPVDGSIAVVVSAPDYAPDCPKPAVRVEAVGGSSGTGGWFHRPDYPQMASIDAAIEMWSRTDLTPSDLDLAELYDGFTYLTFAWLEALGICGEGEAGSYVEGATRIALDGELPLNTYGGQLSAGRMHGYWVFHEACLQLRGEAGDRQVQGDPEVAVVSNGGGPIAGCLLLTR
ncbi:MAG TPA: thiolase family protein [Mycobacteriales bacterium]|nr:thiolase family protein [Mycobacteriales bacterium]